jgi:RNA polymerase sigma-70 factor, ECF subfamily
MTGLAGRMSDDSRRHTVTALLHQWKDGDAKALDALMPIVYDTLRQLARRHMAAERSDHTLEQTALVHEAYLELVHMQVGWNDRAHFFAIASRAMRHILVDHARARNRQKRGGEFIRIEMEEAAEEPAPEPIDLVDLDKALERLSQIDPRKSDMLEMRVFGGLTQDELSEVLGVSIATVNRDLAGAMEWLSAELEPGREAPPI